MPTSTSNANPPVFDPEAQTRRAVSPSNPFRQGDRVRLKDSTRERFGVVGRNWPDEAEVVRVDAKPQGTIVHLRFDGRTKVERWHVSLIEPVEPSASMVNPPSCDPQARKEPPCPFRER